MKTPDRIRAGDLDIALASWGDPEHPPLLALHGWQDNAATFDRLAPLLDNAHVIAPDLPGHGLSQHRGAGAEYTIWSYCTDVLALADALGLDRFNLAGHSMGGAVACLVSALAPSRIRRLVLLDSIGPISTAEEDALAQMRKALAARLDRAKALPSVFSSREAAIRARARRGLDREAAALLAVRGVSAVEAGFSWHHDARLRQINLLGMTETQVEFFLQAIACPVMLLTSDLPDHRARAFERRAALVTDIRHIALTGGHHQHLDGDVDVIAGLVRDFLRD